MFSTAVPEDSPLLYRRKKAVALCGDLWYNPIKVKLYHFDG